MQALSKSQEGDLRETKSDGIIRGTFCKQFVQAIFLSG